MSFNTLNSDDFHAVIIAGCNKLINHKQQINSINVFPVADSDTGDNLSSACLSIIEFSEVKSCLIDTMISIADASIIGARGNSGIILSHFFNLISEFVPDHNQITFFDFSKILIQVGQKIDSVLSNPTEGTIITIIKKLAEYANERKNMDNFASAIHEIIPLLFSEVEKTRETLNVLNQANVVDAGALGFYFFMEGVNDYFQGATQSNKTKINSQHSASAHELSLSSEPKFRYCTEAIIKGDEVDPVNLLKYLNECGDSASLAGNKRANRIHVHTNNPRDLFMSLYKKYLIQYPKVDDMKRQYELQFDKKYKIALVTDSSADLPQSFIDFYQIHEFLFNLHVEDMQLVDKYSFDPNYFYQELSQFKSYPKTSCLNSNLIENKLEKIAKQYEHVIVLTISSKMSGMYDAFKSASKNYNNIHIIDTKTNSAAHGLLLHYAGQLISTEDNIDNILILLKQAISFTFIFVVVPKFESMIRSGRVSKFSGKAADFANIKPIVSIDTDGNGKVVAKCFSLSGAYNKLLRLISNKLQDASYTLEEYCIVHANQIEQAMDLSKKAEKLFHKKPIFIDSVSLSIGLHAGSGCVAIAARLSKNDMNKV